MADIVDLAQEVVSVCTEEAERRARAAARPETHPDFDGFNCLDCGDAIPEPRLRWGRIRCVGCQEIREIEIRAGFWRR